MAGEKLFLEVEKYPLLYQPPHAQVSRPAKLSLRFQKYSSCCGGFPAAMRNRAFTHTAATNERKPKAKNEEESEVKYCSKDFSLTLHS